MNDFMVAKEKARKANADEFEYTNKEGKKKVYKKFVMDTGMVAYKAKVNEFKSEDPVPLAKLPKITFEAIPALLLPVILLFGIYGGVTTPTEAAAVAAAYALFLASFFLTSFLSFVFGISSTSSSLSTSLIASTFFQLRQVKNASTNTMGSQTYHCSKIPIISPSMLILLMLFSHLWSDLAMTCIKKQDRVRRSPLQPA